MTEVEVQQRAKRYLDCLVQGINPLDGTVIPEGDTVRQVRIARCLQYVSGILEQVIENHGEVQRVKKKRSERLPFSLTPEQLLSLKPEPQPVSISEIVQKCNAMIDEYTMCRPVFWKRSPSARTVTGKSPLQTALPWALRRKPYRALIVLIR